MDPETLQEVVQILGTASDDAVTLLWALVILEWVKAIANGVGVVVLLYAIYRAGRFFIEKLAEDGPY